MSTDRPRSAVANCHVRVFGGTEDGKESSTHEIMDYHSIRLKTRIHRNSQIDQTGIRSRLENEDKAVPLEFRIMRVRRSTRFGDIRKR
jgi:hypothetical protein